MFTVISNKSKTKFDDLLLRHGVLTKLSYLGPLIIMYLYLESMPVAVSRFQSLIIALIIITMISIFCSLMDVAIDMYSGLHIARKIPLKSYIQILKIITYVLGSLVVISVLIGKSPWVLLSGVGAMTAVLMLVFRDTILSFVASLQISSSDLIKVGDWVESPNFSADGDVIDIALYHVKVQNWDKTVSTIPTYKLIDSSFKNWRGMSESGGRRVKRSLNIDLSSIKFCDTEMTNRFSNIQFITDYIRSRNSELERLNTENKINLEELVNGRRMTNIGTFRAYIKSYLRNHPRINQNMTLLVRQLQPTESGLTIQLYFFTDTVNWEEYEDIQSDIFDHLLAAVNSFDLKVFQKPSGSDLINLKKV